MSQEVYDNVVSVLLSVHFPYETLLCSHQKSVRLFVGCITHPIHFAKVIFYAYIKS